MTDGNIHGRFAPTPSGRMHLGNVWCALWGWLAVRAQGGTLTLRIEDLDKPKMPAGADELLKDDLRWLGLDWDDEAPYQSTRSDAYAQAGGRLAEMGLTYPCYCSRASLHAAEAPHASDGTPIYQGTCRNLSSDERLARARERKAALRLMVPTASEAAGTISYDDLVLGPQPQVLAEECGDFIIQRSDGIWAYQLAVVVDDAEQGVNLIVRGNDLAGSTQRQIYLQRLLGLPTPAYAHVPLLMASDASHRLSKRERDCDMGVMRDTCRYPQVLLGKVAYLMGLSATTEAMEPDDLVGLWSWEALRALPPAICVPEGFGLG